MRALLDDIRTEIHEATMATVGLDNITISEHPVLSRALAHSLMLIGEAVRQPPESFREAHPSIAWSEARALRNRIVHGYRTIVPDILIETARKDLPLLDAQIQALLKNEAP